MTSAPDFRALMAMNSEEVKDLKVDPPDGWYFGQVVKFMFEKSRVKKTPLIRIFLRLTGAAQEFEDPEDQKTVEGFDWDQASEFHIDYYITPKALSRLTDMLDNVIGDPSRSIDDRVSELRDAEIVAKVVNTLSRDGKRRFPQIEDIVSANNWHPDETE